MKSGNQSYVDGDYDSAFVHFQEAVFQRPNNPLSHYNLGTVLYKQDKFRMAIGAFQTALLNGNSSIDAVLYYNLGNAQFQLNDLEGAIRSYKDSLQLDPHDVDTKHNLEFALQLLKEQQNEFNKQQNQTSQKNDTAQAEPKIISKTETQQLLDQLSKNENKRRQEILKEKLNDGYRREKDW
ncbi:tetratricopeptide repeat protein [Candidatus Poribacteria bacterium]|nr:tetratricopeptide repeat protein [Candidatus Poribacteria bacterium]